MNLSQRIIKKIIRIIEGPPVRDRIVVRTVDISARQGADPCFIIGVYRSGTTLLRYVLDSHSNIAVPPETNFLFQLAELWKSEWVKKGIQGVGIDDEGLSSRLHGFASGIFDDYAAAKGKKRWVDKTPAYTHILGFLDFLFGRQCKYIMLYRHGLDVANSLAIMYESGCMAGPAKEYGDASSQPSRLTFARYWTEQCKKMLAFEEKHSAQCHRIYYEQFATNPEKYLPPLFEFLCEPWEPEVLNFNKKQHDFGLQDSVILETKSFRPKIDTYRSWPESDIAVAKEIISSTMIKLGYEI